MSQHQFAIHKCYGWRVSSLTLISTMKRFSSSVITLKNEAPWHQISFHQRPHRKVISSFIILLLMAKSLIHLKNLLMRKLSKNWSVSLVCSTYDIICWCKKKNRVSDYMSTSYNSFKVLARWYRNQMVSHSNVTLIKNYLRLRIKVFSYKWNGVYTLVYLAHPLHIKCGGDGHNAECYN